MRIVIDARSINKGAAGSVLLGILENLDYSLNEYTLIGDANQLSKLNLPCKIINNKSKSHSITGFINHNLAKEINEHDVYFTPTYIIPRAITINCYCIFTDALYFDKKKFSHRRFTDFIKRKIAKRSYKIADKIFTFSEFTKSRLEALFKNKKDIEIIKPGVLKEFDNVDFTRKKSGGYYVYVGTLKKHKNVETLLAAINNSQSNLGLHIILQDSNLRKKDLRVLKSLMQNPKVTVFRNLKTNQYINEIRDAEALIQPSIYEGYVSPIIEAKVLHTPVIASDITVHREFFSDNEITFFNPNNVDELTNIIKNKKYNDEPFDKAISFSNKDSTTAIISSFKKTEKDPHLRRNFVFNVIYQLLVVLTPLITVPYISRILGASNMGRFSFAYTICFYFIIFGYLGFQQYAQRAIAEVKKNREEQSKIFWQIVIIRLIPVSFALIVLFTLYFLNVFGDYSQLILIFSIVVGSTALDINFFFHGKENFFVVMILNLIIRLVFLACVFLFVKSRYDLNTYAILYSLMILGGYASMWVMLPTNLRKVKLKTLDFKKHMKASMALFLPVAAISIYAILDKTLIGVLMYGQTYQRIGYITIIVNISDLQNGYYYQAEKIIKAMLSIILAFGAVMTTRNTIEYSNKHLGSVKRNIYNSFRFTFAFGVPLALGTIVIAKSFVPLFFGEFYDEVAYLLMIYAPVILLTGTSNILGMQYLLPIKKDKQYSISVLVGFGINLVLNCVLIPYMGAKGAIVGTLISELAIAVIQLAYVSKDLSISIIFKIVWKYVLAGLIMCGICCGLYFFVLDVINVRNVINLIILIPLGGFIYYLVLLILRDKYMFKYSKLYLIKIVKFFKSGSNKKVAQGISYVVTIVSNEHSDRILHKETISTYKELPENEMRKNNGEGSKD